ncbi:hypothetical protein MMC08_001160 [Hypocenomyce scalaris]|nr:hypothetical protein [Hypocenomyce scalaris]
MPPPYPPRRTPTPRLVFLLDFDGTLTRHDTISALASLAYSHPTRRQPPPPPWSHFTDAYLDDLRRYDAHYATRAEQRRSVDEEVAYLRGVRRVERASVERVEGAGVFEGVTGEVVGRGAEEMVRRGEVGLRGGWGRMVRVMMRMGRGGVRVGVVSVNWSRVWVKGVLRAGWEEEEEEEGAEREEGERRGREKGSEDVEVVANELDVDGGGSLGRYWGGEDGGIWTGEDKARVAQEVFGVREGRWNGKISVYVGDSATDLEALMLVDVGIVIRDEVMGSSQVALGETLERVEIECRWIGEFARKEEGGVRKTLWWARDFDDICDSPLFSTLLDRASKP